MHVFVTHCDCGKSFCVCGCCCWAPAPFFFLVWFAVFLTKRKSGRGICGSSAVVLFVVFCWFGFATARMTTVLCAKFYITDASSHVRTEPLSDIGQTGGKKSRRRLAEDLSSKLHQESKRSGACA